MYFAPSFLASCFARVVFPEECDEDDRAQAIAEMQFIRQGIVYRYAAENEFFKVPWPKFVKTLRLMEMRGLIRGGRFIEGLWGEQFADPQALSMLPLAAKEPYHAENAQDPVGMVHRQLMKLGVIIPEAKRFDRPA